MDEAEAVGEPSGEATAVLGAESAVMVRLAEALLGGRAVVLILTVGGIEECCVREWKRAWRRLKVKLARLSKRIGGQVDLARTIGVPGWWEEWLGIPTQW